jgi:hypothetical protein
LAALKFALPTEIYKRTMFKYKLHNWSELNAVQAGSKNETLDVLHQHAFHKLEARLKKQAKVESTTREEIFAKYFNLEQKRAHLKAVETF